MEKQIQDEVQEIKNREESKPTSIYHLLARQGGIMFSGLHASVPFVNWQTGFSTGKGKLNSTFFSLNVSQSENQSALILMCSFKLL